MNRPLRPATGDADIKSSIQEGALPVCLEQALIIRADAGSIMGSGHMMRTLALAQEWQDAGGHAVYATAALPPAMEARLRHEGMGIAQVSAALGSAEDASITVQLADVFKAAWIVVDGYQFGGEYQRIIKESGARLLAVDDYGHAGHYSADLVLNQNLHASHALYHDRESYTGLLLGTRYALLRREFSYWRGWQRHVPEVAHKVLVSFGGGDPGDVTRKVIAAVREIRLPELEVVLLGGALNPHYASLEAAVRASRLPIHIHRSSANMPRLMAWADVAIGAAGSTSWERAFMGLPSILVVLADNQRLLAEHLSLRGTAVSVGVGEDMSAIGLAGVLEGLVMSGADREAMAVAGQKLVDGDGIHRVVQRLSGESIRLRTATLADCDLLWRWANDAAVRSNSFTPAHIPWEQHCKWFKARLENPGYRIFIGLDAEDTAVGQVRFDWGDSDEAEVDISVCSDCRGQGYGASMLDLATRTLFRTTPVASVCGRIKAHNRASIRMFVKAGFQPVFEAERAPEQGGLRYVRQRRMET